MKKCIIIGLTLILFLGFKNEVFAQLTSSKPENEKVIIANSAKELSEQLENITNKKDVTRLYILVKDNIRSWQVLPIWIVRYQ